MINKKQGDKPKILKRTDSINTVETKQTNQQEELKQGENNSDFK